jgi:hypothetical protein
LTQQVHWLDFNKGILLLEMHGTNIKIISAQRARSACYTKKSICHTCAQGELPLLLY